MVTLRKRHFAMKSNSYDRSEKASLTKVTLALYRGMQVSLSARTEHAEYSAPSLMRLRRSPRRLGDRHVQRRSPRSSPPAGLVFCSDHAKTRVARRARRPSRPLRRLRNRLGELGRTIIAATTQKPPTGVLWPASRVTGCCCEKRHIVRRLAGHCSSLPSRADCF